jgi:hypothetical protein
LLSQRSARKGRGGEEDRACGWLRYGLWFVKPQRRGINGNTPAVLVSGPRSPGGLPDQAR